MKMQTYFNITRFLKTLKYDLQLHGKTYLYALAAMTVVFFFYNYYKISTTNILGFRASNNVVEYYRYSLGIFIGDFTFMFFCSLVFVVGTSFPMLRKTTTTSNYLLLPASTLEKFFTQFCIRFLVFPLFYVLIYWITFKLAVIAYFIFEHVPTVKVEIFTFSDAILKSIDDKGTIVIIGISLFTFAGATFFKKYAIFKTIITFLIMGFTYYVFAVAFSYIFIPNWVKGFEPNYFTRTIINNYSNIDFLVYFLFSFSSLFLVFIAYFKLKEKEL